MCVYGHMEVCVFTLLAHDNFPMASPYVLLLIDALACALLGIYFTFYLKLISTVSFHKGILVISPLHTIV